jgi:hypothetical protein
MQLRPLITLNVNGSPAYYYSTEDLHVGTSFYEGRLIKAGTITYQFANTFYGQKALSPVNLELDNSDAHFTNIVKNYELRGQMLTIAWTDLDTSTTYFTESFSVTDVSYDSKELYLTVYSDDGSLWDSDIPYYEINTTTFSSDSIDESALNKTIPVVLGLASYCPLYSIYEDGEGIHDFLIGYGTIDRVLAVWRDDQVVDTAEYTLYDGSQVSPYPGYAFLRFTSEQRDESGNLYEMRASVQGVKVDGTSTSNVVTCFKEILTSHVFGLWQTVNAASWATAAADYPHNCACCLSAHERATDIRDKFLLAMKFAYLYKNSSGEWCIEIKKYKGTNSGTFTKYNMNNTTRSKISTSEYVKQVTVKWSYDSINDRYIGSETVSVSSAYGVSREYESPYTSSWTNGIAEQIRRIYAYQDDIIEFSTGNDGYALKIGDIILVDYSEIGITNARYEIISISFSLDEVTIRAASYSPLIFS